MPAFNAQSTVVHAVRSVLEQTMDSIELVVCDDCSTDGTWDLLSSIRDPRLRLLRNKVNIGPGRSRDRAIAASTGSWIAVIDADDAWHPSRLAQLLGQVEAWGDDVVVFDDLLICHDVEGEMVPWRALHGRRAFGSRGKHSREILLESYIRSDRLLIKPIMPARFIRENRIRHGSRSFGEDAEFFIRLALAGARLLYVPEATYLYRVTPDSVTAKAGNSRHMREFLEDIEAEGGLPLRVRKALREKIVSLNQHAVLYGVRAKLRQGDVSGAVWLLFNNPGALLVLSRRLWGYAWYHMHRTAHRGRDR